MPAKHFLLSLLVAMLALDVNAKAPPAVPSMAVLLNTQVSVIEILHTIMKDVDQFSKYLKTTTQRFETEHYKAMANMQGYFVNPIDVYTLLKRLSWDLKDIKKKMDTFSEKLNETSLIEDGLIYPSLDDSCAAGEILVKLQDYYKLNTTEISNGLLNGVQYSNRLTVTDCYGLGICLFDAKEYFVSNLWMHETLRRLKFETTREISRLEVLEYISFNNYRLEDYERAIQWTEIIMEEFPHHNEAIVNKLVFKKMIQQRREPGIEGTFEVVDLGPEALHTPQRKWFGSLCREEINPAVNVTRRLKCRYDSSGHPFRRLAPFKVEVLYFKPEISIVHDILSDREIQHIKRITRQQLRRINDSTLVSAFLKNSLNIIIQTINRRIVDLTQLPIHPDDVMLVNKYDVSGINNIDRDGRLLPMMTQEVKQHRGAVLLYLTDVQQGGYTVFTTLGLRIKPKKGSAVFVRHIPNTGAKDRRSEFYTCPVILGYKWGATPDNKYTESIVEIKFPSSGFNLNPDEEIKREKIWFWKYDCGWLLSIWIVAAFINDKVVTKELIQKAKMEAN